MARDSLASKLAALRRRGKAEIRRLGTDIRKAGKGSARGRALQHQQDKIREVMADTYLGRVPPKEKRATASRAGDELSQLIGRKGARGRKAAQERANRVAWQQVAVERRGGESALYGGRLGRMQGEQIFWAATRDIWMGTDPSKRLQTVMDALGVSSLEDALDMVLSENSEAITAALDARGGDFADAAAAEARDSDIWIAFIASYYMDRSGDLQVARR